MELLGIIVAVILVTIFWRLFAFLGALAIALFALIAIVVLIAGG